MPRTRKPKSTQKETFTDKVIEKSKTLDIPAITSEEMLAIYCALIVTIAGTMPGLPAKNIRLTTMKSAQHKIGLMLGLEKPE